MRRAMIGLGVLAVAVTGLPTAEAQVRVSQNVAVPVHVDLTSAVVCDNTGPQVTVSGWIGIGSVETRVWFQNNAKGTQSTAPEVTGLGVSIAPSAGTVTIAKAPVAGADYAGVGAGGNPWISFDVQQAGASSIGGPVLIGKCVQLGKGNFSVKTVRDFVMSVPTTLLASAMTCTHDSSGVSLSADADYGGIDGLLLFDNNQTKVVHQAQAAGKAALTLVAPVKSSKGGWGVAGAGGNPLVYAHFGGVTGSDPTAWPSNVNLGRCNKI